MSLLKNPLTSSFFRMLKHLPGFSNPIRHSLVFLNITQFLGSLNDNIFKLVMAFLLIQTMGSENASSILSAAGAVFVIPFLIFSSSAGVLADRFSKQRMIIIMKAVEIGIMCLAIFAFALQSAWASFTLLFLLAIHSAMFGPSKYAIIPEIVPEDAVARANGLITSFTYLAIILGTFLASFLTEMTHQNFVLVAGFCLLIAIMGFICSFGIKKTPAQGSKKKISPLFLREIYHTLVFCRKRKHLLVTLFGSAFFLFVGAFTQLNIIPFGIQSLNLSAVAGGYLFLSTALGIAFGSFIGGKISKKKIEPGLSCLAGLAMAVFFLFLDLFSSNLIAVLICLILLGVSGGIFIVPLDSFNQMNSTDEKRGQVIGSANFLSFVGVLLASFALYFFSQIIGLSSAHGFAVMSIITLLVSIAMIFRLSDLFLSFLIRKITRRILKIQTLNFDFFQNSTSTLLILQNANWTKAFKLMNVIPELHFFTEKQKPVRFPWLENCFYSIHKISKQNKFEKIIDECQKFHSENMLSCYLAKGPLPIDVEDFHPSLWKRIIKKQPQILFVKIDSSQIGIRPIVIFSKTPFPDEFF